MTGACQFFDVTIVVADGARSALPNSVTEAMIANAAAISTNPALFCMPTKRESDESRSRNSLKNPTGAAAPLRKVGHNRRNLREWNSDAVPLVGPA